MLNERKKDRMNRLFKIVLNGFKLNAKSYTGIFYSSILSLSTLFVINSIYMCTKKINESGYLGDNMISFMFGVSGLLSVVTLTFVIYAINSFVRLRISDYSIYLVLGISRYHLFLFIGFEVMIISAFLLVTSIVCGIIASAILITSLSNFFDIKLELFYVQSFLALFIIYFGVLLISFGITMIKLRRYGHLKFISSRKYVNDIKEITIVQIIRFIFGLVFIIYSIYLIKDYSVARMFVSLFINIAGIYLIFNGIGIICKKLIERQRSIYYKNIIKWSRFFSNFNQNKRILFILYTINVIAIVIICGVATTVILNRNQGYDQSYPYDLVCISDEEIYEQDNFEMYHKTESIKIQDDSDHHMFAIKESEYNSITYVDKYALKYNELIFYSQRVPEEFMPVEDSSILLGDEQFRIVETDWKVIWGERLNDEFIDIIIMNDATFEKIKGQYQTTYIYAIDFSEQMHNKLDQKVEGEFYYKEYLVKGRELKELTELLVFIIVGILLVLESSSIIYTKFFAEKLRIQEEYTLFKYLGMKRRNMKLSLKGELRSIYFPVLLIASVYATYIFLLDASFQGYIAKETVLVYLSLNVIFTGCQILYTEIVIHSLYTEIIRKGISDAYNTN